MPLTHEWVGYVDKLQAALLRTCSARSRGRDVSWLDALVRHRDAGVDCMVVTITAVRGSAPRGVGTRMTISAGAFDGTIGGGALEHDAIAAARTMLASATIETITTETLSLGKALSQCCGGEVTLQFEHHPGVGFPIEIFGAGHVAQEVARLVSRLPCIATFHDERAAWLEGIQALELGSSVRTELLGVNVHDAVERGPADAFWLVMTHSHERDMEAVEAILSRGDSAYCGLIASRSKAASFRGRLERKGFDAAEIARLTAPLGQQVETGNTPMEVAIAAVGDVLTARTRSMA